MTRALILILALTSMGLTAPAPSTAATLTPGDVIARMTARWTSYTDPSGVTWSPRSPTLGTDRYSTALVGKPIAGTTQPNLYQANVIGATGYAKPVPSAGSYSVRLLMAEEYYTKPGQRVFDVTAEGRTVAAGVDIVAAVGKAAAHDVRFTTDVTDGTLNLGFVASKDLPLISAIEVRYAGEVSAPVETFAFRMSSGSVAVTDRAGNAWAPRDEHVMGGYVSTRLAGTAIPGTQDDALYQSNVWAMRHWGVATPHTATYRVRLLLAEDYWKQPGERVFDVRAEGKTVAEGVDAAAAVGAGVAHEVSFTTRVVDGVLSLDFVPIRDNPAISAIEVTSTDPALIGLGSIPRKAVTLSPTSFYTTDIRDAPVAENSDLIVADLTAQVARQWEGVAAVNAYQYNTAFYTVAPGAATTTVAFDDCQKKGYVPSGLFDGPAYFVDVPVPPDAQATAGTDAQLTVYDPAADKIWEFWQMRRAPSGGWQACWGGRIDDVSTSQGIFPEPYGASASGLLMAPGMISIDEARLRRIDHAMYLAVHDTRAGAFSWPANRTDGDTDDENVVAEGQRLRLDPSLDVTKLGLSPFATMVARAAQKYGFVVADRAHAVAVVTESGAAMKRETGSDPWDGLLGGPSYSVLKGFPWDKLQALPLDHGRP